MLAFTDSLHHPEIFLPFTVFLFPTPYNAEDNAQNQPEGDGDYQCPENTGHLLQSFFRFFGDNKPIYFDVDIFQPPAPNCCNKPAALMTVTSEAARSTDVRSFLMTAARLLPIKPQPMMPTFKISLFKIGKRSRGSSMNEKIFSFG